jgi:hypothetical protein
MLIVTTESPFTTRIGVLLATDIALTILNAYIPHELSPIRTLIALIQLAFMAATMALAIQWVLEDY